MHTELLRSEVTHYLILGDQLKALYRDIDEETLQDTLEGISDLPELIKAVIRSSLEDEVLIGALKQRVEDMEARLSRLKDVAPEPIAAELWGRSRVPSAMGLRPAASLQPAQSTPTQSSLAGMEAAAENTVLQN